MKPFNVKGKHQVACAIERIPALSTYEGVQVTFKDENGGWLHSCDVGVPTSVILQLSNQGQWSEEMKERMIRRRIEQIMEDSQRLPTGPVPDLTIDDHPIYLAR